MINRTSLLTALTSIGLFVFVMLCLPSARQVLARFALGGSLRAPATQLPIDRESKTITVYFPALTAIAHEQATISASVCATDLLCNVMGAWVHVLAKEQYNPGLELETAFVLDPDLAFISFKNVPFPSHCSVEEKMLLIESLLATIARASLPVQYVQLYVRNEPLEDDHLDFSLPWPIEGYPRE